MHVWQCGGSKPRRHSGVWLPGGDLAHACLSLTRTACANSPCRSNGNKLTWQSCEYGDSLTWADAVDAELAKKGINTSKYK